MLRPLSTITLPDPPMRSFEAAARPGGSAPAPRLARRRRTTARLRIVPAGARIVTILRSRPARPGVPS